MAKKVTPAPKLTIAAGTQTVFFSQAGHIGQNVMLAATNHGLSACPTAALSHSAIKRLLGLDRLTDAPIYALTISTPQTCPSSAGQSIN
ncbi:nitroreductase family protein [Mesorhizobium kowhaii]|uniref:Nitroreductase domain-containing protein n=1 Tax=Mesorhizobium kowhaii TaxID=1300272 RepID=A0A2W7BTU5_9HYPH|nr:nitroreductase family protein [Mesorhizobium kowhaii]PZV34290.1 hypothetical protein B5V02_34390 [Mesorhizobium kowhaii]